MKATANGSFHLVNGRFFVCSRGRQFTQKGIIAPYLSILPPIIVDDCVAKDSIEPGYGAFLVLERVIVLKGSREALLQEILSNGLFTDPPLQEP
jgi:hypothetical protein